MLNTLSAFLVFSLALGLGQPAHAYLDPGTGSMFLQLLLGGIAGALVTLRLYWAQIKLYFSSRKSAKTETTEKQ